jgi:carbon-monoxide dehydrogenase large subunit
MGIEPSKVRVTVGDTEGLDRGWGTVASRSAVVAGNAVAVASRTVFDQIRRAASEMLEASSDDLWLVDDRVALKGAPDRAVTIADLERSSAAPLSAQEYFEPRTVTWASGVHAASVSIDPGTGEVRILRYGVAHDCGHLINPMIVEGQIHGGVAQGIAGALFEEVIYDDSAQLLTATLADYLIPTAADIPTLRLEHLETPSPGNALGLKGVGEGGAIPAAAALANAVEAALGPDASVIRRTPLGPAQVLSMIHADTS